MLLGLLWAVLRGVYAAPAPARDHLKALVKEQGVQLGAAAVQ